MLETGRWVKQIAELGRRDVGLAGGKGAYLGELTRRGVPVPPGFVIIAPAYLAALDGSGVRGTLCEAGRRAEEDDASDTATRAQALQALVQRAGCSEALKAAVGTAYRAFGDRVPVAVRSSAIEEDMGETSFAGIHATFTNVVGLETLCARVLDCWASLWSARALAYRAQHGLKGEPAMAVVVQRMVDAEVSGVMFTVEPATDNTEALVIEAAYGLGQSVVSGAVEPDSYRVSRRDLSLLSVRVGEKAQRLDRGADGLEVWSDAAEPMRKARALSQASVQGLARLGVQIETLCGSPQDIEFAIDSNELWILQTRPITASALRSSSEPLVSGVGAAPGRGTGRVRVLATAEDASAFQAGEVLVATMTSPDWVPKMRQAAAVVTDAGGLTCHAAIVARELAVPCVVGTKRATTTLTTGQSVTVDGTEGTVVAASVAR